MSLNVCQENISITVDNTNTTRHKKVPEFSAEKVKSKKIRDSEPEEGEITDDDDDEEEQKDSKVVPPPPKKPLLDLKLVYRHYQKPSLHIPENTINKRFKITPYDIQRNEIRKSSPKVDSTGECPKKDSNPDVGLSSLRVLTVGDDRVFSFNWMDWDNLPQQFFHCLYQYDLESFCLMVEKHLYKEYDFAVLFGFHYDFVLKKKVILKNGQIVTLLDLKENVNINEIIRVVKKFHDKWKRQYPSTKVIWALPSPPNFLKYNYQVVSREGNKYTKTVIDRKEQFRLSKDYFELTRKVEKEWRNKINDIPVFPLHKVLFMKKPFYKSSFDKHRSPKFPKGMLTDGVSASKMMALYCAYLLIEFIIDKDLISNCRRNINLEEAELKLFRLFPKFKDIVSSSQTSSSNCESDAFRKRGKSSRRSRTKSPVRKKSNARRSRGSSSRHRTKSRSKGRARTRSRSTTQSSSKNNKNTSADTSLSSIVIGSSDTSPAKDKKSSPLLRRSVSVVSLSSTTVSTIDDSTSPSKTQTNQTKTPNNGDKSNQEELTFWNTLKYLREVHDVQCSIFRRKPHTHPLYRTEKDQFMKKNSSIKSKEELIGKWEEFWKTRMEELLEQNWIEKKKEVTEDLNVKFNFTPISSSDNPQSSDNANVGGTISQSSDEYSLQRVKLKLENSKIIQSFLRDCRNASEQSNVPSADANQPTLNSCNFSSPGMSNDGVKSDRDDPDSSALEIDEDVILSGSRRTSKDEKSSSVVSPKLKTDLDNLSDSDLDIDGIMDDPDFAQGLDDLDKELQNAMPSPEVVNKSPVNDLASIFSDNVETKKTYDENFKTELVDILKMLFRVSKRLGPLGKSVTLLYHNVLKEIKDKNEINSCLNSDSKSLLQQVCEKLSVSLNEDLSEVQRAIYNELSERLHQLLSKMSDSSYNKFPKLNIQNIATATLGSQVSDVMSFIKNALLYHGYHLFTSNDVLDIYMSVKALQIDLDHR